ncbi:MAG: 2-dehydropantoate 2-reductase [Alphaproteobacteria bacterium]|jgi:2-dehydropantoate 2-reductase|nr:2-dehydropantoate 2-reductase [Rhodospirillaceae bacterium]MBT6512402.1 2-dehydropantoate 2-reductase [Rhodospirillaceae bacterium]MBT7613667.1 2-dehydropantoate 2-reductase [Rhodospirillaceae bacterium]MBT7645876.1 2-dehydropantoate 2-reductase [Rhodospirillaceae bacterium]MDG2482242.1 2-dehydropantoate 2-reductase [Alphaproteobacteria bacterium]
MTRIAIYGAGAIGGYMGALLSDTTAEVTLIARGPHLAAIREKGLTLEMGGESTTRTIAATDNPAEAGEQDFVIIALKAHSVPGVVDAMQPLLGKQTALVTAVNGVPWWYFHGLEGPWRDRRLESVDPGGRQWAGIGPDRAIGCVVYPACDIREPGTVQHIEGNRFILGEPSGEKTERVELLAGLMRDAGFKTPVKSRIRDDIWVKLWGNLCFNPVSALTGATLEQIGTNPDTRALCRAMMIEAQAIGEKLGVRFAVDVDKRINGATAVGAHRTSMLQDQDQGRPMEIDALVTAVQELGRIVEQPTPTLDAVLALIQQKAELAGLYKR